MSREWRPGDIVAVRMNGNAATAVRVASGILRDGPDGPCWMLLTLDGKAKGDGGFVRDYVAADARPLVVLDPENADDVNRLRVAYYDAMRDLPMGSPTLNQDAMQAALRELANPTPPKPEEPTGLGAVVEDADGIDWHRNREGRWLAGDGLHTKAAGWDFVGAVRVLSEGVTE